MSPGRRLAFLVAVAAQAVLPLGLIGWNEVQLARGTEVRLRTVPVDPLDLFRGRYVRLRYDISSVRVPRDVAPGATVYVPLRREGEHWTGGAATRERPDGGTFIRGWVTEVYGGRAQIEYGIETYYADEDEAPRLERERLYVDVVLGPDGKARISGVEVVR